MSRTQYAIRCAGIGDREELAAFIARSARGLCGSVYTEKQIEGALLGPFGVDTQLVRDGTYFVVEEAGRIIGCGGWSRRRTLFGSDQRPDRDDAELDPRTDAARIRAFFVDPAHARRGIGSAILHHCEAEARRAGFSRFELMATLSGVDLYRAHGYSSGGSVLHPLPGGDTIEFVPMSKAALRGPK